MMPLIGYDSLCEIQQSSIVSRDRKQKREHRANNPNRYNVSHYQIDGYVIQNDSARCDFLLMNDSKQIAYLIELKGSDIEHALEQLESTAAQLKGMLRNYGIKYRLVFSRARTQAINGTKFKRFKKKHAAKDEFLYGENLIKETI